MKELLEKLAELDRIDESVDPTPADVKRIDEVASMNISMSGDNANEVAQLVSIMRGTGADAKPVDADMINPPMDKLRAIVGPKEPEDDMRGGDMDDLKPGIQKMPCKVCGKVHLGNSGCGESTEEIETDEEWDNAPDEEYKDHQYMTKDLSGGINREKDQYAKANDGDNAMAVEELKSALRDALMAKMSEGGDEEGDHDHDEGECPECGEPGKKKLMACASCGCS